MHRLLDSCSGKHKHIVRCTCYSFSERRLPYSSPLNYAMNKRSDTEPHCFISVVGPTGCGKTLLVAEMLVNQKNVFKPPFDKLLYFCNHFQPKYKSLSIRMLGEKNSIEFYREKTWSAIDKCETQKLRTKVVIDDLYQQASQDEYFLELVVLGRHRNVHLITMKHNLYQQTKNSKTIDLNISQLILFNGPRDVGQISILGRQLGQRKLLLETYKKATLKPYGHLLIDLDSRADQKLKVSTICSGGGPSTCFITTSKTLETVQNESTRLLYA